MRRPGQRNMRGLFADRDVKDFLFAIYALYHELETITPRTQEFSLGEVGLKWRRETLLAFKLEGNFSKHFMV